MAHELWRRKRADRRLGPEPPQLPPMVVGDWINWDSISVVTPLRNVCCAIIDRLLQDDRSVCCWNRCIYRLLVFTLVVGICSPGKSGSWWLSKLLKLREQPYGPRYCSFPYYDGFIQSKSSELFGARSYDICGRSHGARLNVMWSWFGPIADSTMAHQH